LNQKTKVEYIFLDDTIRQNGVCVVLCREIIYSLNGHPGISAKELICFFD